MKKIALMAFISLFLSSCAQLMQVTSQLATIPATGSQVTNAENISGLKSSLSIGIEHAVSALGVENGFYKNTALKLLLPAEAQPIIDNIKLVPGGQALVDKTVLSLNRSAEDAVKEATPIFKNAITNMSITDAAGILFGNNNAATEYLRRNTYSQLKVAFAPKVKASLAKPLVANISTTNTWSSLSSAYNVVAGSAVGSISGLKTVNVDLENYVTEKALDALFVKVAAEENAFRTNPAARISDLLKKVFGQLDKK
ncbi:MAG: DUF4197 domain-containing protein [Bacteroidota bacterium]|nr:DUF4197 domain-containing protein [Bacteroidota bacterium]